MLKKLLIIVTLTIINNYCLADDASRIKPILKEYPAPQDMSLYPLENKITNDLVIYTPVPNAIATTVVHYLYNNTNRSYIAFSSSSEKDYRVLLDNVFGLKETTKNNLDTISYINLLKNNKAEITEINLRSKKYRAFVVITKDDKQLYKYSVYILPQTEVNNIIRMITLNHFNKKQAEKIIGTLKVIGD